jgi:hypothetical protein
MESTALQNRFASTCPAMQKNKEEKRAYSILKRQKERSKILIL